MTDFWQSLLVYLLVLWCFWRAVKKFAPNGVWQMQARLSYAFESRNAGWLKHIGRALRPAIARIGHIRGERHAACRFDLARRRLGEQSNFPMTGVKPERDG